MWKIGTLTLPWWERRMVQLLWKMVWCYLKKLNKGRLALRHFCQLWVSCLWVPSISSVALSRLSFRTLYQSLVSGLPRTPGQESSGVKGALLCEVL